MHHPSSVWVDIAYKDLALSKLIAEYKVHLRGRTNRAAPGTPDTYANSILNFARSLAAHGDPPTLASLTPFAVRRWVAGMREAGRKEEGIATRLNQLKVFANKFVHKDLELTTVDLLARVPRLTVSPAVTPALEPDQIEAIIDAFDRPTFGDVRDRAFLVALAATGLRFDEARRLKCEDLDRVSGEVVVTLKGGDGHLARLSPRALKFVKAYLRVRPDGSDALWVTERGTPLSYQGGQSVFRRFRARTGIRVHAHLFRHTFVQHALRSGAGAAEVQDMVGHKSDAMTRRYSGTVRKRRAAEMMPRYSPV